MKVRLADIAERAEVSEATVSRVLNNKPGVAESTRQAVLTALDVLGYYRPTRLQPQSTSLVGVILPELTNPIFAAFGQAIEILLARQGYTPLICTQTVGGGHEDAYVATLLDRGVSGIIYVSGFHANTAADPIRYTRLRDRGLPLVFVNGFLPGIDAPFISHDDEASVRLAVRHLVDLGHTKIGLAIGQDRYVPVVRKARAFAAALAALGVRDPGRWVEKTVFTVEGGAAAAARLLAAGATGIVCGSDLMALGVIRQARSLGLDVPGDVSVVGFDDSPLMAFTDPPLTTIRQCVDAMAEAAVSALLAEIGGHPSSRGEFMFAPELVVRGSTGAAPRRRAAARG